MDHVRARSAAPIGRLHVRRRLLRERRTRSSRHHRGHARLPKRHRRHLAIDIQQPPLRTRRSHPRERRHHRTSPRTAHPVLAREDESPHWRSHAGKNSESKPYAELDRLYPRAPYSECPGRSGIRVGHRCPYGQPLLQEEAAHHIGRSKSLRAGVLTEFSEKTNRQGATAVQSACPTTGWSVLAGPEDGSLYHEPRCPLLPRIGDSCSC